jgi:nitrate/TMAO reductase-like tetraheme cytochrome c subunit
MALADRLAGWLRPVVFLGHNPLTLTGAVLTTSAGLTLVGFWAIEILGNRPTHPYAGIFLFLILPALFVLGLVLMPIGVLWRRRALRARGELPEAYPRLDFSQPFLRDAATLVFAATVLNVAILGTATYKGVEHMDSVQFCGLTCHQVMAPEYTAYVDSPHSRVACVQCHIGPGADWFVRSKLSGTRQLLAVAFGTYSRPIPSPVHELRPARETCEQCHWPRKFHGDKLVVRTKFSEDEANTRLTTVLMLRIGGHAGVGSSGIHGRHLDDTERIRYDSTHGRQVISRVTYLDDAGKTLEYASDEAPTKTGPPGEVEHRSMDCVDCHNRPTHAFQLPERAVDRALAEGRISPELPFVRKKSVEILRTEYPDRETAGKRIVESLGEFYKSSYPAVYADRRALVDAAAAQVRDIYLRNVFPEMKITWGTYPNNIGHDDFTGCFRCHDDKHKSANGKVISQDCTACHAVLAMEESDPKVLAELGLK